MGDYCRRAMAPGPARALRRPLLKQPMIVAVVDDDPSMLKGIHRLLNARGLAVEVFDSAEAFLASFSAARATCLLLDLQLRGMSGLELQRHLAASGSRLPIIDRKSTRLNSSHL